MTRYTNWENVSNDPIPDTHLGAIDSAAHLLDEYGMGQAVTHGDNDEAGLVVLVATAKIGRRREVGVCWHREPGSDDCNTWVVHRRRRWF